MNGVWRRGVLVAIDIVVSVLAVLVAFVVRFAFDGRPIPVEFLQVYAAALPLIIPIRLVIFWRFGMYRQVWAHASVRELIQVMWAATADLMASTAVIFGIVLPFLLPGSGMARSVLIIAWMLNVSALGGVRVLLRIRHEWLQHRGVGQVSQHPTMIFGAGDAGAMLTRELLKHSDLGYKVVGFIDDDRDKQGYHVAGVRVLGTRKDLEMLVARHGVTHLIIAMPSARGHECRDVVDTASRLGLQLKTVPGLFELVNGRISVSQIRDVQIEDILGREEVKADLPAIAAYLQGETLLVTGAGGSIGSELCRQVARFGPRRLVLLGHGENSIYDIHLELQQQYPQLELCPVIADIQDEARIQEVFAQFRPGVVFHAAAHKHVPLMEENPVEAIKNNVFGTLNVARAADRFKVRRFVLISSDKAVNPTSVMGATKRAAECVVQELGRRSQTVFAAVRFGNVLGSRGSVVPLFKRQIAAGGPITITDPRMVRYFMTIPEAVQLVIQAGSMAAGGEVFILDMGKPVRIVDLARDMIRLSGLEPDVDIAIAYTGIRHGEKLFEELLTSEEGTTATQHERIFVAPGNPAVSPAVQTLLEGLNEMTSAGHATNEGIRTLINNVLGAVHLRTAVEA